MRIKCLGGFREVGKTAVLVESKENVLFDYGMEVETGNLPKPVDKVNAIVLGHAHLDHSGYCPYIYRKFKPPIYSTIVTFELAHLLLKDSIKVAKFRGFTKRFDKKDIEKMKKHEERINYGQKIENKHFSLDIFDAGHIPGSTSPLLEIENKRVLYACDFNLNSSHLLNGARIDAKDVDVLILENTYSERDHPPRQETEKKFYETVEETIANEGIVIIPSFAVGRAAEILMVLNEFKPWFPIYLDGMAKTATEIVLKYPEFLRDAKNLKKSLKNTTQIWNPEDRKKIIKEPCVIVSSSGMLEGGPSVSYIKYLYNNSESSVIFTGFLLPKTAGRTLMDTGRFVTEGFDLKIKMGVYQYDFSAHSGRSDLFNFVNRINPRKVICLHGDSCEKFAKELRDKGFDAVAPKNGDSIDID